MDWYDPSIDKWAYGPSLTNEHCGGAALTLNNRIFVCGGNDLSGHASTTSLHRLSEHHFICVIMRDQIDRICEAYDPRSNAKEWQQLSRMTIPRSHFGWIAISSYSCLAVGGYSSTEQRFNPNGGRTVLEYDV
jgi:hypothetical protein